MAVLALLEHTDLARDGLRLPARSGKVLPRTYLLAPATLERLQASAKLYGFTQQASIVERERS